MNFGPTELLLILAIVLIIFGAGKLPQVLGSLGKGVREFREASEGSEASSTATVSPSTTTTSTSPGAPAATTTQPTTTAHSQANTPSDQPTSPR